MPSAECRYCNALESFCDEEQVARSVDGILFIGGQTPTKQQLEELAKEGALVKSIGLWKVLTETVKSQALELGIKNAKDFDQLLFAKAMLHVVAIQESTIKAITSQNAKMEGR
jgi:hypothetical protein